MKRSINKQHHPNSPGCTVTMPGTTSRPQSALLWWDLCFLLSLILITDVPCVGASPSIGRRPIQLWGTVSFATKQQQQQQQQQQQSLIPFRYHQDVTHKAIINQRHRHYDISSFFSPSSSPSSSSCPMQFPRGGHSTSSSSSSSSSSSFEQRGSASYQPSSGLINVVAGITQLLVSLGRAVLPPLVATVKGVIRFYNALPMDAIIAQVGLIYCFLGGYYPTLFSSLQAARYCGWHVMVNAISDLIEEAMKVVDATENMDHWDTRTAREKFFEQTDIVLKTIDPMKINQAAAALYTTWLGVSAVLEREYARVISLSLTLAQGVETVGRIIVQPPLQMVVPKDYHKWIPAIIGWTAKGIAMNVAWRIQRVLTASTSAIAGGMMFARAVMGMLNHRGILVFGDVETLRPDETTLFEEIIGFSVGSLGFYTQMECQVKNNFSFVVKFPFNLLTWPFDVAERWIQWYITK
jgi:hypothetical protein